MLSTDKNNAKITDIPKSTTKDTIQPAIPKVEAPKPTSTAQTQNVLTSSPITNGGTKENNNPHVFCSNSDQQLQLIKKEIATANSINELKNVLLKIVFLFGSALGLPKSGLLDPVTKAQNCAYICLQNQAESTNKKAPISKPKNLKSNMTFQELRDRKRANRTWIDDFDEYATKISSFKWGDLSTKEYTIVQVLGKWYVKCKSYSNFQKAIQSVIEAGKRTGVPRPFLFLHPNSHENVSLNRKKAGNARRKARNAKKRALAKDALCKPNETRADINQKVNAIAL